MMFRAELLRSSSLRAPVFPIVVASIALAACGRANVPSSEVLPEARAVAAGDAGLASRVRTDAVASGVSAQVTSVVGLAKFGPPPANAIARNDRGVSALAKGKAGDAVKELEAAVALAPDFILARYNLACARAKSGDHVGARAELEAVFAADFVGVRAQAQKDGDLTDFWKSEPGKDLAAHTPALEARYESVLARGLRAILWRDGSSQRGIVKPSMVRVGVFDTATTRFVPVAPPLPRAFFGFASSTIPFAVVATGTVRDMLGGDIDAGKVLERVYAYPISTKGVPSATVPVNVEPYSGNLRIWNTGLFLDACQSAGSLGKDPNGDEYCASFDLRFGGLVTQKLHTASVHPTSSTISPGEPSVAIVLGANHWGYVVTETAPSYVYKPLELSLPSGAKLAVPKEAAFYRAPPREIVPSPTGDRIVLVWNATVLVCDPAQDIPGRYKLSLLETASGRVTQLGEGDGAGHATFRADGELFVQRGRRVYQVARNGTQTELPEGVLLVPPLERSDECGF